jgi:photosystem II stability/assembly factor-like uncharacterized protein
MNVKFLPLCLKAALITGVLSSAAAAAPEPDVLNRPALKVERLQGRTFLALAVAGKRIVAVGERGLIALSDDDGASWRQANSPVSTTLTCVSFADTKSGWVAGHAGTILHTADGGATWAVQTDGRAVARLVKMSANEKGAPSGLAGIATQLVADGPDKPFLDIQFTDVNHGAAVGAYGLAVKTSDGGRTWVSFMHHVPNPKGLHLYAVRVVGETVWLAGEQGYFARSVTAGEDFRSIETPYRGSYFALASTGKGVVVAGLKGNAFHVSQDGSSFGRIDGAPPVSFSGVTALRDGRLAFTNQAGQVLVLTEGATRVALLPGVPRAPLSAVVQAPDGKLVLAGAAGLEAVPASQAKIGGQP